MSIAHYRDNYRPEIDGLRAVAVLLVVLYHVGLPGVVGGFIGVDVFFVISGYLITSLLVQEAETHGRISLTNFYARRVRRLFPALMVVVLVTLLLGAVWLLPVFAEQTDLAKSAIATAFYVSNFYFWQFTGEYFGRPAELEPLLHTWTLAVEEQFYLLWPLVILGALRLSRRSNAHFRRSLLSLVTGVLVLSFAIGVWQTGAHPRAAFYLMPARAWEFAVGAIVALILSHKKAPASAVGTWLSALGLLLIIGSAMYLNEESPFPGLNALMPTLGACAVIAGGVLDQRSLATRFLTTRPMVAIGLLSYSWYLWHWPLLAISRAAALQSPSLSRDLLMAAISLLAAALTYQFIENPIRYRRPGPFSTTVSTLWAGAVISVAIAGCAVLLGLSAHYVGAQPRYVAAETARRDIPPLRRPCHQDEPFDGLANQSRCTMGDPQNVQAMLWGDSHADHLSPLMQAYVAEHGTLGMVHRSFSSCRPLEPDAARTMELTRDCMKFNAAVEEELSQLRAQGLKGVALSAMWLTMFNDKKRAFSGHTLAAAVPSTDAQADYATKAIDEFVSKLEKHGIRVLIIAPTWIMPYRVPQCLLRRGAEQCSALREPIEVKRQAALAALRKVEAAHPGTVRIWDPIDDLCDARVCPAQRGTTAMYTDDLHLSASAAQQLLDSAREPLTWLIQGR
jgi:peptidoglycan/LPS O-acetylase OafA/YrhL